MRTLLMTTAVLALATATHAEAQQRHVPTAGGPMATAGPQRGGWNARPHMNPSRGTAPRWSGRVAGRWWGGMRAPGGWNAYRRPVRGWVLPGYWVTPRWYVNDWSAYGLRQPPQGYNWSRYYDDAVLIDGRGAVYDSVGGIGWDRYDDNGADDRHDDGAYPGGYPDGGYPQLPYPAPYASRDADNGLGGAAVGAVVGGVAGNVIAGRGNRLGGTLLGAGAGALAGMAIDRSDRAGRVEDRAPGAPFPPPPGYGHSPRAGAPYPPPGANGAPVVAYQQGSYGGDYAGTTYSGTTTYGAAPGYGRGPHDQGPPPGYGASQSFVTGNGTVVTTSSTLGSAGYVAGGYYYPGATITTVTVTGGGGNSYVEEYGEHHAKGRRYTKGCNC